MKVWYCKVHGIADIEEAVPKFCWLSLAQHAHFPCEFVDMRLVAEDALLAECSDAALQEEWIRRTTKRSTSADQVGEPG